MPSLLALLLVLSPQEPATLAEYLKAHPESSGLTVNGEGTKAGGEGQGLARYGRKLVHLGGIAAVVPTTMVRFEESPQETPNLYDGLPRDEKVLYLMSLLDAEGWRRLGDAGLGLNDVHGEARAVLASLLPKHPVVERYRVGADYGFGPQLSRTELDERAAAGMRLRVVRDLDINLRLADVPNASSGFSPSFEERGKPGGTFAYRDPNHEDDEDKTYGVTIRTTVPNALKKGQLDTSRLGGAVTLPARTTVGEALARIGAATGREILADARVRGQSVAYPGGAARAGDLLDALAMAVAGTYRRVGGTTLLVSDVVGMGSRKLRLALWKESIDMEVRRRKLEWIGTVAKSGLAAAAHYPDDPTMQPTPEVERRVAASLKNPGQAEWFSPNELSPEQQAFLDRTTARHKNGSYLRDKVSVQTTMRYQFVMPDGTALQTEGFLGSDSQFVPHPAYAPMKPDPAVPMGANPEGALRPLVVRPGSSEEVRAALALAKAYGFTELWVETERAETLAEALRGGLPVRLYVRPWAAAGGGDRNVLGESGRAVAARQGTDPMWIDYAENRRMEVYPRLGPQLADGDLISPFDPAWPARRAAIAGLARTPGLAGVVLNDAAPNGYAAEEEDSATVGVYTRHLRESWAFGYDERARLAFFREKGIDPIDLWSFGIRYDVDPDTPTFWRYADPRAQETFGEWTAFRAKANELALAALRTDLGDLPMLIDVRHALGALQPDGQTTLAPWPRGGELPSTTEQFVPPIDGAVPIVSAPANRNSLAMTDFGNAVKRFAPMAEVPHAFDLTRVPAAAWDDLLRRWLKTRPDAGVK